MVDSFLEADAAVLATTVLLFKDSTFTTALLFDVAAEPLFEEATVATVEWPFEDTVAAEVKLLLEDAAVLTIQLLLEGTALLAADFEGSALVAEEVLFEDVEQVVAGMLFEEAALVTVELLFEEITAVAATELFFEDTVLVTATLLLGTTGVVVLLFCCDTAGATVELTLLDVTAAVTTQLLLAFKETSVRTVELIFETVAPVETTVALVADETAAETVELDALGAATPECGMDELTLEVTKVLSAITRALGGEETTELELSTAICRAGLAAEVTSVSDAEAPDADVSGRVKASLATASGYSSRGSILTCTSGFGDRTAGFSGRLASTFTSCCSFEAQGFRDCGFGG